METALSCRELTKSYGSLPALGGVTFDIYKGRTVGLLGPAGSGKTTLIKLAAGLLTADSGEITVSGVRVGTSTKKRVSYLPDRDCLPENWEISEIIKLFSSFYDDFSAAKAFDILDRMGIDINKKFKDQSKGMRGKIQLALTVSRRAELYLLDEPLADTDPASREYILSEVMSDLGRDSAAVIATHLISDIEPLLDDVLVLRCGTVLVYDSAEGLRSKTNKSLQEYFREEHKC